MSDDTELALQRAAAHGQALAAYKQGFQDGALLTLAPGLGCPGAGGGRSWTDVHTLYGARLRVSVEFVGDEPNWPEWFLEQRVARARERSDNVYGRGRL